MRTSLQFFKDLGVCDGAYAVLERVFAQAGVTEFDYALGYEVMLGMMDQLEIDAAESGEDGHDTAQGWLSWCHELRNRADAIMYFGDHIEENIFKTSDGYLHENLQAAQEHRRRRLNEVRMDYERSHTLNGVKSESSGAETWVTITPGAVDETEFDSFVWHDVRTGLNHYSGNLAEAEAAHNDQREVIEALLADESGSPIERRIKDNTEQYMVWIPAE